MWVSSCVCVRVLAVCVAVLLYCELGIYYGAIVQCDWPELRGTGTHTQRHTDTHTGERAVLRALFLADTHLLGSLRGHWFDKLRREWQMERAFQTALWFLQPEIVFILGDLFDEGKWSSAQDWQEDVRRFWRMFRHGAGTELFAVAGNHDVGFHSEMNRYKLQRFESEFNFTSARVITRKGINVALHGDKCSICSKVETELLRLSTALKCSQKLDGESCSEKESFPASAPVLLQHYPLYRASDTQCTGEDSAPPREKDLLFRERYDVLSQEASRKLLEWFNPRLVLSGHTHSGCLVLHRGGRVPEITLPSFSWRNRNNPSFLLITMTADDYGVSKCFLPQESSVMAVYLTSGAALLTLTLRWPRGLTWAPRWLGRRGG